MGAAVQLESSVERFVRAPVRKMLIDGKWVEAASGKTFDTPNPATGEVVETTFDFAPFAPFAGAFACGASDKPEGGGRTNWTGEKICSGL